MENLILSASNMSDWIHVFFAIFGMFIIFGIVAYVVSKYEDNTNKINNKSNTDDDNNNANCLFNIIIIAIIICVCSIANCKGCSSHHGRSNEDPEYQGDFSRHT